MQQLPVLAPNLLFLNGVAPVPNRSSAAILVSDSAAGLIWRVDTLTGACSVAMDDPTRKVPPGSSSDIGVNGLTTHGKYVYWTNSAEVAIYRLKLTREGFPAEGAEVVEEVVDVERVDAPFLDDLTIDWSWRREHNLGDYQRGQHLDRAGGRMYGCQVRQREEGPGGTLHVTTDGGILNPVNGTLIEGGKVVAVDTSAFCSDAE